ncbi:MAG: hypothetical protein ACFCD0_22140 [Gemmataceae bacterium]
MGQFVHGHIERVRRKGTGEALALFLFTGIFGFLVQTPFHGIVFAIFLALFLYTFAKAVSYYVRPNTEPLSKAFAVHGDPRRVADAIESERRQAIYESQFTLITPTWILQRANRRKWNVARMEDVIWAYLDVSEQTGSSRKTAAHQLFLFTMQGIEIGVQDRLYKIQEAWMRL